MQQRSIVFSMAMLTLLGIALAQTPISNFKEKAAECKQRTGATEADVQVIYKPVRAPTYAAKCMRACLMKEYNIMSPNGKLRSDGTGEYSSCFALKVSANHCEAAEAYNDCIIKESKRRGK